MNIKFIWNALYQQENKLVPKSIVIFGIITRLFGFHIPPMIMFIDHIPVYSVTITTLGLYENLWKIGGLTKKVPLQLININSFTSIHYMSLKCLPRSPVSFDGRFLRSSGLRPGFWPSLFWRPWSWSPISWRWPGILRVWIVGAARVAAGINTGIAAHYRVRHFSSLWNSLTS